jgi:hypothetical protein
MALVLVREAAELLRTLLDAIEKGELDAPPIIVARLSGALAALEELKA